MTGFTTAPSARPTSTTSTTRPPRAPRASRSRAAPTTTTSCFSRAARRAISRSASASTQLPFCQKLAEHPAYDEFWSGAGARSDPGAPAARGADHVRHEPVGPGGHVRRNAHLPGDRAQGQRQRPQLPGARSLAPQRRQLRRHDARAAEVRRQHRAAVPPRRDAAVSRRAPARTARRRRSTPPVFVFETGTNVVAAPAALAAVVRRRAARRAPQPLYLQPDFGLAFTRRRAQAARRTTSTSPIRPSRCRTCRGRCTSRTRDGLADAGWSPISASVADRTDVLTYTSAVLTAPLHLGGAPLVNLFASTSGTDSDWVVKLIDVYPDEVPADPPMGGYQLRDRAWTSSAAATATASSSRRAIPAGKVQRYRFALPHVEPRVPARPPHHGAGPVELVPALRPQPADLRGQHLLRQPRRLPQGHAAGVPHRRRGELHRLCRWWRNPRA